MITVNPINVNKVTRNISFGEKSKNSNRIGLMSLDKNANNKINFEKDLFITKKADPVQSNPLKAIGYNVVKAYNTMHSKKTCNPNRIKLYSLTIYGIMYNGKLRKT